MIASVERFGFVGRCDFEEKDNDSSCGLVYSGDFSAYQ